MAQQPKVVKVGPGGRSNGPRPKVENPGKVFKRILAYVMSRYKAQVIVVLCCILLAVFAQQEQYPHSMNSCLLHISFTFLYFYLLLYISTRLALRFTCIQSIPPSGQR